MGISNRLNKNINMPFLGISIIVVVGLIWAAGNFFNAKDGTVSQKQNAAPMGFDSAGFEVDRQNSAAAESDISYSNQDDVLFEEIDRTSDDISEANNPAFDEKSLSEEALAADISGDIKALDNGIVQNEIDQSINDVVQY